ncbi:MAG: hypothetical protein ABIK28_13505 [Planctomycetota bacterium]
MSFCNDKNTHAASRMADFNPYATPCVYFDGGYKVDLGAGSTPSAKATYLNSLSQCGALTVSDLDAEVLVLWMGNATMKIMVKVTNNEATPYRGRLRVYVNEIVSSFNWKDTAGKMYTFPFLAFAFNDQIIINAGDTWEGTMMWNGNDYNSGHGQNFGSIQRDNLMVIAAVFNNAWHQGYSKPPSAFPFNAYYPDEVVGATPAPLSADAFSVSETGGTVNLDLQPGASYALRNYLIIGSASGTTPGLTLPGGLNLPVNWDAFSDLEMSLLNVAIFMNFMGQVSPSGTASAQLVVPALPPGYAGTMMYYAYTMNNPFNFASNPIEIEIVP